MGKKGINYMLVGLIVLIHQIIGFIWYSPFMFGNIWKNNIYLEVEQLRAIYGLSPFLLAILCSLLFCMLLNKLISMTGTNDILGGIKLAFMLWLGVAFTTLAVHYSFLGLSKIILIDAGKDLIAMVIAGGMLASANEGEEAINS